MTRKDYELIAEVLVAAVVRVERRSATRYNVGAAHEVYRIVDEFADALKNTNPLFDRVRFIEAATGGRA